MAWSGSQLQIGGGGATLVAISTHDDSVVNVAPLPGAIAWLAVEDNSKAPFPQRLIRASIDAPLTPRATIAVAPWSVWDLGATSSAVAAMLHRHEPPDLEPQGRDLVIYAPDGRERWRTPFDKTDMNAFVALGDTRVVVVRGDRGFDAWDVATGARVPVA